MLREPSPGLWGHLNQMPEKHINSVINDTILKKDQETCKNILEKMLQENLTAENKK
jgi:hypothetical protein